MFKYIKMATRGKYTSRTKMQTTKLDNHNNDQVIELFINPF